MSTLCVQLLGEAATTEIARQRNADGFGQNRVVAREGGTVAGNARRELEVKSGKRVVKTSNYMIEKPKSKSLPPG